jgi:integrase
MSVRRVRRGAYQVRWREAGRGSPAHSVMVYGTTDAEAKRKADTIDAEIRNSKAAGGRVISIVADRPEPLTLAEFLPVWHEAYGKDLARKTQQTYAVVWDKWVAPRLGGRLLSDLSPRELVSFRVEIEAAGAGAQTVMKVFTVLGSVLSEAVRQGHIHASPTRAISRPKQRRPRAVRPPTPDRVEIIRAGLESGVERALVTLLAYVGLRPQEALAAVWSDMTGGKLVVDAAKTGRTRVVHCCRSCARNLSSCGCVRGDRGRRRRSSRLSAAMPGARAGFGRSAGTGGRRSRRGCGRMTCATRTCR